MTERYPDVSAGCTYVKFPDARGRRGQKETPVAADEDPPRISVIDLATAITKKDANHAAQDVGYVKDRHPEVTQILGDFKFRKDQQKHEAIMHGATMQLPFRDRRCSAPLALEFLTTHKIIPQQSIEGAAR